MPGHSYRLLTHWQSAAICWQFVALQVAQAWPKVCVSEVLAVNLMEAKVVKQ